MLQTVKNLIIIIIQNRLKVTITVERDLIRVENNKARFIKKWKKSWKRKKDSNQNRRDSLKPINSVVMIKNAIFFEIHFHLYIINDY